MAKVRIYPIVEFVLTLICLAFSLTAHGNYGAKFEDKRSTSGQSVEHYGLWGYCSGTEDVNDRPFHKLKCSKWTFDGKKPVPEPDFETKVKVARIMVIVSNVFCGWVLLLTGLAMCNKLNGRPANITIAGSALLNSILLLVACVSLILALQAHHDGKDEPEKEFGWSAILPFLGFIFSGILFVLTLVILLIGIFCPRHPKQSMIANKASSKNQQPSQLAPQAGDADPNVKFHPIPIKHFDPPPSSKRMDRSYSPGPGAGRRPHSPRHGDRRTRFREE